MKSIVPCLAALVFAFAACGGSSSSGSETGAVTVALTDAASLELASLRLDVTGVQLRKSSDTLVEALAGPVSVDLVSLEDSSRVLCLTALPAGKYTHVALSFDLSTAQAYILNNSTPAAILDWESNPHPPVLTMPVRISDDLRINGGRHRLLEIDFDIDQSVRVDQPNNTLFIEPAFVFRIDPPDPKDVLVMGRLESVKANRLELGLEDELGTPLQTVNAAVAPDCVYQIDGVSLIGASGLAALAGLPVGASVQAYGLPRAEAPSIAVAYVEAGTGTYGGGLDIVEGHVIGTTGTTSPTLTVYGSTTNASHTTIESGVIVTVLTDSFETRVVPYGTATPTSLDDLNVGQRVRAYGSLNGTMLAAGLPDSVLRLMPEHVFGLALGPPSGGNLVMDLEQVGILSETTFQWNEGGATPLDPDAMIASVGSLAANLVIGGGTPVDLRGSFSPLGEGSFDFSATSVTDLSTAAPLLLLQNRAGGAILAATVAPGEIELALSGALGLNEFALIDRGYLGTTALPPAPPFKALGGSGYFLVRNRQTAQVVSLTDFTDFGAVLSQAIGSGAEIYFFGARGAYDEVANTMQVDLATAVVD